MPDISLPCNGGNPLDATEDHVPFVPLLEGYFHTTGVKYRTKCEISDSCDRYPKTFRHFIHRNEDFHQPSPLCNTARYVLLLVIALTISNNKAFYSFFRLLSSYNLLLADICFLFPFVSFSHSKQFYPKWHGRFSK